MFGGQGLGNQVYRLVEDWIPRKKYRSESKFQNDLKDYLNDQLQGGGGLLDPMGSGEIPIRRERGKANADVVVDDEVGIELKRNFTNNQANTLRGQIENYMEVYPFVIVCACGINDQGAWRELKQKYEGQQGFGIGQSSTVRFIHKKKENMGKQSGSSGGGLFGGDGLF